MRVRATLVLTSERLTSVRAVKVGPLRIQFFKVPTKTWGVWSHRLTVSVWRVHFMVTFIGKED